MNKLSGETSTYLLQHANNPVDWYPWGEEALTRSRLEDRPILLSVGYAACHWCHVMEHESFEDADTARLMNEYFVCIKVDREERTDLDEIYMKAVQMMTGHGGWPMTVFLTPQLKPFFGGTYFPPVEKHGLPSFKKLLTAVNTAWQTKRSELEESAQAISLHLSSINNFAGHLKPDLALHDKERKDLIDRAMERMLQSFDKTWGGFGGAPKFPHTFSLDLAMRCNSRTLRAELSELLTITLDCMATGGIHDQIGGGFARYSTDRQWLVPHFEKMLYDNALLCQTYLNGFRLTGRSYWKRVALAILDFILRDLTSPQGAFYSSLDADSEGVEGKYYVWRKEEIETILGEDAAWFCQVYGVTPAGNFEDGTNILHLKGAMDDETWWKIAPLNEKLLAHRQNRVAPGVDEKILTGWNSLMISALVDGYSLTADEKYLHAAKRAARFILEELSKDGRLFRTWGQGKAQLNGYLDDYAYFTQALLDLASVDGDPQWLSNALLMNEAALRHFKDKDSPGFFYTSDDHESLLVRPRCEFDGAVPSANAICVLNLLRLSEIKNDDHYRQVADAAIRSYEPLFERAPDQLSTMIAALDFSLARLPVFVLAQKDVSAQVESGGLLFALHKHYLPNKVVVVIKEGLKPYPDLILLKDKMTPGSGPAVFLCQNHMCDAPIVLPEELDTRLAQLKNEAD
jgi:uncharacterized protein YyaL (SSP411 family)